MAFPIRSTTRSLHNSRSYSKLSMIKGIGRKVFKVLRTGTSGIRTRYRSTVRGTRAGYGRLTSTRISTRRVLRGLGVRLIYVGLPLTLAWLAWRIEEAGEVQTKCTLRLMECQGAAASNLEVLLKWLGLGS